MRRGHLRVSQTLAQDATTISVTLAACRHLGVRLAQAPGEKSTRSHRDEEPLRSRCSGGLGRVDRAEELVEPVGVLVDELLLVGVPDLVVTRAVVDCFQAGRVRHGGRDSDVRRPRDK